MANYDAILFSCKYWPIHEKITLKTKVSFKCVVQRATSRCAVHGSSYRHALLMELIVDGILNPPEFWVDSGFFENSGPMSKNHSIFVMNRKSF